MAYTKNVNSSFLELCAVTRFADLINLLGHSFLPQGRLNVVGTDFICNWVPSVCDFFIDLIVGKSHRFNDTRLPVYISQTPAGTSTKNMVHFSQGIRHEVFGEYDYGASMNRKAYGQDTPPQYNLTEMRVPIVLVTAGKDLLADPLDVDMLMAKLPSTVNRQRIHIADYAHLDFTWAEDASERLYPQILAAMKNVTAPSQLVSRPFLV